MPHKDISYFRRWHYQFLFGLSPAPAPLPGLKRKQNTWWWNKQGYFQDAQGNWVREQAQGDGVDDPNAAYGPAPAAADASNPYDANGGLKDSLKTPIQGVFFGLMLLNGY